jgi:predicted esterase
MWNKSIAIVHGTADEDVAFKHSAALAKTFIETGANFQFKVRKKKENFV